MLKKILLLVLLLIFSFNVQAFDISIPPEISINSDRITLEEISIIEAGDLSAAELKKLKKLDFGRAPLPGYEKTLSQALVEISIKNLGYNNNDFKLTMPSDIVVKRNSSQITAEQIAEVVKKQLKKKANIDKDKILIKINSQPDPIMIPAGEYEIIINDNYNLKLGQNTVVLEIYQNGSQYKKIYVPLKLGVKMTVFKAKRRFNHGEKINREDFEKVEDEVYSDKNNLVSEWNNKKINGKVFRRSLPAGSYLSYDDFKDPVLVRWGDRVKAVVEINNISVTAFVTARGRGKLGDIIEVENPQTGFRFQAEVISASEVRFMSK
ncbi:flagellar basal body P-ring formation chaperone FlgA [Halanaerobium sp. MA284_MarDTE_T2]|uniref:flagellar basal body P-ring formation chaperone FlgA n=1 Tax=Halanaerobium sp. MA284_MarDTE_T2 TaxID=2183913 RepID=UPI000DF12EAF|nr:flagellar basal body P-ring formation chaperone FlgA [Halanaerobium sp. MA284_MarDTE_T2]RCW47665.1 flagella basal body P-ring formation protein FlgA [Halanaerobium sp. MA284_MarDTE_T2]